MLLFEVDRQRSARKAISGVLLTTSPAAAVAEPPRPLADGITSSAAENCRTYVLK
jgi:hypothetical protein